MDNNIDIPEFFVCPISLGLMNDPVTTLSGITYDRSSIQRWLSTSNKCPVTMQPLTAGPTILTPNHTLSRMLRAWCSAHNVPIEDPVFPTTPKPSPTRAHVAGLIDDLRGPDPEPKIVSLQKLEALASESDRNRVLLGRADLTSPLTSFVVACYEVRSTGGLREALSLFFLVFESLPRPIIPSQTSSVIEALLWVLGGAADDGDRAVTKPYAAHFLKCVIERARPSSINGLRPEFFETVLANLRAESLDSSLLKVLLDSCSSGRNRDLMVKIGVVSGLVEAEMRGGGEKEATELVLEILCYLCSNAEGRAQLVGHPSGISMVTKRILKVSPAADDSAVFVIWMVSRYSGTSGVLREMGRVGTVGKLCMVMQANCDKQLKEKAKDILRAHSDVWRGSTGMNVVKLRQ